MSKSQNRIGMYLMAGLLAILFCMGLLVSMSLGEEPTRVIDDPDTEVIEGKAIEEELVPIPDSAGGASGITIDTSIRPLPGFLNVISLGCKTYGQDPDFDNAPILTEAFRTNKLYAGLAIPAQIYGIKRTVYMPQWIGGKVIGAGGCQGEADYRFFGVEYLNQHGRSASCVVWTGAMNEDNFGQIVNGDLSDGGVMWRCRSLGADIDGITLSGRVRRGIGPRASVGLQFYHNSYTGKGMIKRLNLNELKVGIQHGDLIDHRNAACDHANSGYIMASGCEVAYQVCHSQSNTHNGEFLELRHTTTGFDFTAKGGGHTGGVLNWDSVNVPLNGCKTILRLGKTGRATGTFTINQLRIDAQVRDCKWLDASRSAGPAKIQFNNIIDNGDNDGPRVIAYGTKIIRIQNAVIGDGYLHTYAFDNNKKPLVFLENCEIRGQSLNDPKRVSYGYNIPDLDIGRIEFIRCYNANGKRVHEDEVVEGVLMQGVPDMSGIFQRRAVPQDANFYALAP